MFALVAEPLSAAAVSQLTMKAATESGSSK